MNCIWKDFETGNYVCDVTVIDRLASLLLLQREFYAKRDKRLLAECKRREDAFLEWYDRVRSAITKDMAQL